VIGGKEFISSLFPLLERAMSKEAPLKVLQAPSLRDGFQLAEAALRSKRVLVIIGACTVNYSGRASSYLALGERILIWKPDGTLLIHQDRMREPVNWNPPGSRVKVELRDTLDIISWRNRPRERMKASFNRIDLIVSTHLRDEERIRMMGVEEELVQMVYDDPSILGEGFKIYRVEKPVTSGFMDLYGEDKEGNPVVVEFKGGKADVSAVNQLLRYLTELGGHAKGILVAPGISRSAYALLVKEKLRYIKLSPFHPHEKSQERQARITRYSREG
jgi:RecB family endonuclease NucS